MFTGNSCEILTVRPLRVIIPKHFDKFELLPKKAVFQKPPWPADEAKVSGRRRSVVWWSAGAHAATLLHSGEHVDPQASYRHVLIVNVAWNNYIASSLCFLGHGEGQSQRPRRRSSASSIAFSNCSFRAWPPGSRPKVVIPGTPISSFHPASPSGFPLAAAHLTLNQEPRRSCDSCSSELRRSSQPLRHHQRKPPRYGEAHMSFVLALADLECLRCSERVHWAAYMRQHFSATWPPN